TSASLKASIEETGAWSEQVRGLRGRLIVKEDKPFHGTRMIAVYMELENVSDVGNQMEFYFDPISSIESKLVDENGKEVEQPPTAADVATPAPFWLALPHDGTLKFRISVTGYGVYDHSGTNVQMSSGNWLIKPNDKGKYYLEATYTSTPPKADKRRAWSDSLNLPKVLITH
ncbi:MAG: hypothetical protein ACRD43_06485, partial [Pyrinomonadaceae bacterium]